LFSEASASLQSILEDFQYETDTLICGIYVAVALASTALAGGIWRATAGAWDLKLWLTAAVSLIAAEIFYRRLLNSIDGWAVAVRALVNTARDPLREKYGLRHPVSNADERRMWEAQTGAIFYGYDPEQEKVLADYRITDEKSRSASHRTTHADGFEFAPSPSAAQAAIPADADALGQSGRISGTVAIGSLTGILKVRRIAALTTASLRADAEASPDTTVLSAWAYVEAAISDLGRVLGISDEPDCALDADAVLSELARRGARPGPESTRSVLRRLLRRKTSVQRGEQVSAAEAHDFSVAALHVTDLLLGAYAKTQGKPGPGLLG
jgi:hypothetical protein